MRTNIDIDGKLIEKAMAFTGLTTKKEIVNLALSEFVKVNDRKAIKQYRGKNIWEGNLEEMRKT